jgi:hypothetical protein
VRIAVELQFELKPQVKSVPVIGALFVRRSMGDSLNRTLRRFAIELASDRELL